ncbi:sensor domain-containing protein [Janthinobacterium sp. 64]|uniref:sensor domain-containing protein n=1 Tax=Janthinobacterium sp. 64 TaxID=2035208 RepID=UPI000C2C0392|nr:diguanylate cyclase [Janthinobacterium sp. 64]PKB20687.1 diguanylate cyclase with PAS/PAC and GAF sensors [Janthinobacterium sp. 64]
MKHLISAPVASFTDLLLDAVCMVDVKGRFVFVSAACERIFGYTQQEMIGMVMLDLVAPADRQRTIAAAQAIMDGHAQVHFENRYTRKDGRVAHIMWSARWSATDQLRVAVARDITTLKQTQAKQAALYAISEAAHATEELPALLQRIHQIVRELLPACGLTVSLRDEHGQHLHHAQQELELDGTPATHAALAGLLCEEVQHSGRALLIEPGQLAGLPPALQGAAADLPEYWLAVPLQSSRGIIGVLVLQSGQGAATGNEHELDLLQFVAKQLAIAIERKQLQSRMHFMAMHDELTRLPNRRLFHDRLQTAFARAQRHDGRLSLLFLDLNRFKVINDQYGHACGDLLLQAVASRIRACLRETDTLARLGGDEFVVLLENNPLSHDVMLIEQKIHAALATPLRLGDERHLRISVSIGVAHYPDDGDTMQLLLRHADRAMYASKAGAAER